MSIVRCSDVIEFGAWIRRELFAALKDNRGTGYSISNDFLIRDISDSLVLMSGRKMPLMTTDKAGLVAYANKLKVRYDWLIS